MGDGGDKRHVLISSHFFLTSAWHFSAGAAKVPVRATRVVSVVDSTGAEKTRVGCS
jgi:hypothetical protein